MENILLYDDVAGSKLGRFGTLRDLRNGAVIGEIFLAYRFQKEMAPKVALRLFAVFATITGICVGVTALGGEEKQVLVVKNQTPTIQTASPQTAGLQADAAVVTLNTAMIQQQGFLVVVSKKSQWPKDYEPPLVDIKDYKTTSAYGLKDNRMRGNKTAVMALDAMFVDAGKNGFKGFVIMSSYRGYEKQKILFDQRVSELMQQGKSRDQAEVLANQTVAKPGESEHQTGLAFDLAAKDIAMEQFGDTVQGKWIEDHCADYGFVLRYPPEKAAITGISNEPWHIRYVGVDVAKVMVQNNWCLEEYMAHQP